MRQHWRRCAVPLHLYLHHWNLSLSNSHVREVRPTDLATLAGVAEQRPPSVTPGDRVSPRLSTSQRLIEEGIRFHDGHPSTLGASLLLRSRSPRNLVLDTGTFSIERRRAKASSNRAFACYGHCRRQKEILHHWSLARCTPPRALRCERNRS